MNMEDMSSSRKDDNRREEEFPGTADIESGAPPTDGSGDTTETTEISVESEKAQLRRILHRVPPQLREKYKHIYEPSAVSLGPYHHGQPHLRQYEDFKSEALNVIFKLNSDDDRVAKDKGVIFRREILHRVDEIRSFYEGLSMMKEHDDEAFVEMMVRDACLVVYHMATGVDQKIAEHALQSIGALGVALMADNFYKLENQIPWWIIKLLIGLISDNNKGGVFIRNFLSFANFRDHNKLKMLPWEEEGADIEEPLHFLEARRRSYLNKEIIKSYYTHDSGGESSGSSLIERRTSQFHSAKELSAKGIRFSPGSECLNDVRFSSYFSKGVLRLPVLRVGSETATLLANIIVLEMSPGSTRAEFPVTSYVGLMKSLIQKPKDVKMLKQSGILVSYLKDNEQIIRMFNEIDTHGVDNFDFFNDVKKRINEHCSSWTKTWKAEMTRTYFANPWTILSVYNAIFVLLLALLQTYYAARQRNNGK